MRIRIEAPEAVGLADAGAFVTTTVAFAIWPDAPRIAGVDVRVEPVPGPEGTAHHRCTLVAETRDGVTVAAGATGEDAWDAVREAARLLEVALFRPPVRPVPSAPRRGTGRRGGAPARPLAA